MASDLRRRLVAALGRGGQSTSDYDLNAGFGRAGERPLRQAGVLVGVATYTPVPMLIMTKRASHLSQHPGQIAFPGGKVEAGDRDPIDAALREAEEEIGLAPSRVEVLGPLPSHETVTGYSMVPVLGLIDAPFEARPEEGEVAEVFAVPLDFVTAAANYRVESRFWRGVERRYYTVPWGPYYIWGATALVLRRLTDRLAPVKVDGDWLRDPGAQAFLAALDGHGHQGLFVGGCVRNTLMGRVAGDLDIATDARPEKVVEIAEAAGFRAIPTGIAHGTVTVIAQRTPLEVTTFRRDVETDGRRAVVAFSTRVEEDAARRDFTMNALYVDRGGKVIDPLGGLPDLRARRVRFIGEARARIREDYLRILRYFRFHAWYGDPSEGIDAEALAASADLAEGLDRLSAERITAETLKLLAAPDPAPAIASMARAGILARILPGAEPALLAPLVHLEATLGTAGEPIRRLAVLGGERDRLRLSRRDARRLDLLIRGITDAAGAAETAWRHGAMAARDIELLRAAAFSAPLPADLEHRIESGAGAVFPVSGRDLQHLPGPERGSALRDLEARWIGSGFTLTRDDLLT